MGLFDIRKKHLMPGEGEALPGREETMPVPENHYVNGNPLKPPFPKQMQQAVFGMGCFWGVERMFWQHPGVFTTAAGFARFQERNGPMAATNISAPKIGRNVLLK